MEKAQTGALTELFQGKANKFFRPLLQKTPEGDGDSTRLCFKSPKKMKQNEIDNSKNSSPHNADCCFAFQVRELFINAPEKGEKQAKMVFEPEKDSQTELAFAAPE